ncbi:MAG: SAM-dependent methyltransferase [Candidatus Marinimicrobia bacterium]|nr:SAM-dependent methyltransferase [Candidatus Neomarinimicrobiota bacterium]
MKESAPIAHQPIMKDEVVAHLVTNRSGIYLDCTVGFGGHANEIIKKLNDDGRLIGLDCDPDAFSYCIEKFHKMNHKIKIFKSNYSDYDKILNKLKISQIDGALIDLGISSYQIDEPGRGFSYRYDAPLDMRFDTNYKLKASDVLNTYSKEKLSLVIKNYGEERNYRNIARSISIYSKKGLMNTTYDLKDAVKKAGYRGSLTKVLSRVFQSIRIEVNSEFEKIKSIIESLPNRIKIGGRLAFITFHSLEDRIVKRALLEMDGKSIEDIYGKRKIKIMNKKVIKPSREEVLSNRRSRSAKLRVVGIV